MEKMRPFNGNYSTFNKVGLVVQFSSSPQTFIKGFEQIIERSLDTEGIDNVLLEIKLIAL